MRDLPPPSIVHVIDDDSSIRQALDSLFRSLGLKVLTYGSADDFLSSSPPDSPGCILLDVRLPGLGGMEAQARLAESGELLPIVLMSGHGDIPMSVQAMKAGAVDFLVKPFREQEVIAAVGVAIDRDERRRASVRHDLELHRRYATLSERERQVVELVTSGKMNKQAAGELGLKEITVKVHRGSAMRKLNARSFAELLRMMDALKG